MFNVEEVEHMGHVLRVWHDLATNWYFDIDRRNPAKVAFAF